MINSSLQAALRSAADGLYALEAGTGLIIAHGAWTERCDFGCFIHHGTGTAAINWEAAIDAGTLPRSGGEKRMLRLAGDIPIRLGDADTDIDIDQRNAGLPVKAILRQFPRLPLPRSRARARRPAPGQPMGHPAHAG
jgi:hypothetical protein